MPALRPRPEVPPERRPWMRDDLDPEQVARETLAEIQEALKGLHAILDLLGRPPCPGPARPVHEVQEEARGRRLPKCGPARDHRG